MRLAVVFLSSMMAIISLPGQAGQVIPIWGDETPPYAKAHDVEEYEAECWDAVCAYQVVRPTLTLFLPRERPNGNAVVVLPGGGYEVEAVYHEGYEIAQALAAAGTVAAVLKYRLPSPETSTEPEKVPIADVRRSLGLLRSRQGELGFEAKRFGVLGFSAGSHLATLASVHPAADPAANPDFSILVYGVTRMNRENREWLEKTLYHRKMSEDEVARQTLLDHVDSRTPPAFLVHALDDDTCHYTESTLYAEALTEQGVEAEMHLFARGGHGFGPGRAEDGTDQWLPLASAWLGRMATEEETE